MTDNQRRAIDELSLYKEAKRDIQDIKNKIEMHETKCNRITKSCDSIMQDSGRRDDKGHVIYVPVVVQVSGGNSRETLLDVLMDTRMAYSAKQAEAERLCRTIEMLIYERCSGAYARILSNLYLYNVTIEKISVMENFCYAQTKRKKWRALEMYGSKMQKEEPR